MAKFCGLLRVYVLYNRDLRVVIFQKDAVCTWIHHHIPHLHQYHQSLITNRPLYLRWSICCLRFSSWLLDHLIYLKFRIMVFCYQNCSSDREKLFKFEAEGREFVNFWDHYLGQFVRAVKGLLLDHMIYLKFRIKWYFATKIVLKYCEKKKWYLYQEKTN